MSLYYKYNPLGLGNVQPPIVNVRGVFLQSNSILVSSALTVKDCTLASGASADLMDIYDYGRAVGCTISSGGIAHVSSGGSATKTTIEYNGKMDVYGVVDSATVSSGGTLTVSSGGLALNITSAPGAIVTVLEGGTITYK